MDVGNDVTRVHRWQLDDTVCGGSPRSAYYGLDQRRAFCFWFGKCSGKEIGARNYRLCTIMPLMSLDTENNHGLREDLKIHLIILSVFILTVGGRIRSEAMASVFNKIPLGHWNRNGFNGKHFSDITT